MGLGLRQGEVGLAVVTRGEYRVVGELVDGEVRVRTAGSSAAPLLSGATLDKRCYTLVADPAVGDTPARRLLLFKEQPRV